MGIHFLNWIARNILVIKLLGFAEIFILLTPAPVVSVLVGMHITERHHKYDIICDHVCHDVMYEFIVQNNLSCLKNVYN